MKKIKVTLTLGSEDVLSEGAKLAEEARNNCPATASAFPEWLQLLAMSVSEGTYKEFTDIDLTEVASERVRLQLAKGIILASMEVMSHTTRKEGEEE